MNKREKTLAGVVFALFALMGLRHFYGQYAEALRTRRADVQTAQAKLQDANLKLAEGRRAVQQMEAWQKQSLPANTERAFTLYKAWLLDKAKEVGLSVTDIKVSPIASNSTAYTAVGYNMVATGSLSAVTKMLYEFYHSPQLQQVTRLQLSRQPGASQLNVNLDVEALSLKGAIATNELPKGESKRLKLASVKDYEKTFTERNLVVAYKPPAPPTPPREKREPTAPPKFDDAEFAMFSGTIGSAGDMQAWITVRTTGETLHVKAGDPVKVGTLEGEVVSVEPRMLVLKMGDKKFEVPLGASIRKGKEISAGAEAKPHTNTEPSKS
jgi:hypothetical protein